MAAESLLATSVVVRSLEPQRLPRFGGKSLCLERLVFVDLAHEVDSSLLRLVNPVHSRVRRRNCLCLGECLSPTRAKLNARASSSCIV